LGNVLGQELVIYQTGGTVTVADRWRPHRGMALEYGRVMSEEVERPYHGWVFVAGSERCIAILSLPQGAKPPTVSLRTYPNKEAYGLVWSCLGDPLMPIPDLPAGGQGNPQGWDLFRRPPGRRSTSRGHRF
jgi:phenylpropionate dioxygenase-like ring-hydroxylating dioxygenase large terminal subunit